MVMSQEEVLKHKKWSNLVLFNQYVLDDDLMVKHHPTIKQLNISKKMTKNKENVYKTKQSTNSVGDLYYFTKNYMQAAKPT